MNKNLAYGLVASLFLGIVACNNGGGGGGGAPAPTPAPGQTPSPFGQIPGQTQQGGFQSVNGQWHIARGRIVNRQLRLYMGVVRERGQDSCIPSLTKEYDVAAYMNPSTANIILNFDGNGNLSMALVNPAGDMRNTTPLTYNLDGHARTITIFGPATGAGFELAGAPSAGYVNLELRRASISDRRNFSGMGRQFGVRSNAEQIFNSFNFSNGIGFSSLGSVGGNEPAFDPNWSPGQPLPGTIYAQQAQAIGMLPGASGNPGDGRVSAVFAGIQARIHTAPGMPQTILGMSLGGNGAGEASYQSNTLVTRGGAQCASQGTVQFQAVLR